MKNPDATRTFSDEHEKSICRVLGGRQTSGSGSNRFEKGDIIISDASLLVEAKCQMSEKSSCSIKKEWIEKSKQEAFRNRLSNNAICFNFGPGSPNYYVIDEKLMCFLKDCLIDNAEAEKTFSL